MQATEKLPPPIIPEVEAKPEVDEDPLEKDGLTLRQRQFVEAIVGPAGGNATKAARMAGYRDDNEKALGVTAHRMLGNARIQEAIGFAYAKLKCTPEWCMNALYELTGASMSSFITVDEKGRSTIDWIKANEAGALGQIKEYREEGHQLPGDEGLVVVKRSIKIHDRLAALQLYFKLIGVLKERHEHSGPDGKPISTEVTHKIDYDKYRNLLASRYGQPVTANSNRNPTENSN